MNTQKTPLNKCPRCEVEVDQATHMEAEHATPTPGCFSICIMCGFVSVFADDLTLRRPGEEERQAIKGNVEIQKYLSALHAFWISESQRNN